MTKSQNKFTGFSQNNLVANWKFRLPTKQVRVTVFFSSQVAQDKCNNDEAVFGYIFVIENILSQRVSHTKWFLYK